MADRDRPDGGLAIELPERATSEEAAAITAAIEAFLAAERRDAEAVDDRAGRRWTFAGRLAQLGIEGDRVPDGAPADGWTAAGRAERF